MAGGGDPAGRAISHAGLLLSTATQRWWRLFQGRLYILEGVASLAVYLRQCGGGASESCRESGQPGQNPQTSAQRLKTKTSGLVCPVILYVHTIIVWALIVHILLWLLENVEWLCNTINMTYDKQSLSLSLRNVVHDDFRELLSAFVTSWRQGVEVLAAIGSRTSIPSWSDNSITEKLHHNNS